MTPDSPRQDSPALPSDPVEEAQASQIDHWLHEMLELPKRASRADTHRAMLERIEQDGFTSDESLLLATSLLAGQPPHEHSEQRVLEWQLRKELDDYCEEFFGLHPSQRQADYGRLAKRAALFPHLWRRLEQLRPALSIDPTLLLKLDSNAAGLGNVQLEMFVLPPLERAHRRHEELTRFQDAAFRAKTAAARINSDCAEIANLESEFLFEVGMWSRVNEEQRLEPSRECIANVADTVSIEDNTTPSFERLPRGSATRKKRRDLLGLGEWVLMAMGFLGILALMFPVIPEPSDVSSPEMPFGADLTASDIDAGLDAMSFLNAVEMPPLPDEFREQPEGGVLDPERAEMSLDPFAPAENLSGGLLSAEQLQKLLKNDDSPKELGRKIVRLRDTLKAGRGFDEELDPTLEAISRELGVSEEYLNFDAAKLLLQYDRHRLRGHEFGEEVDKAAVYLRKYTSIKMIEIPAEKD